MYGGPEARERARRESESRVRAISEAYLAGATAGATAGMEIAKREHAKAHKEKARFSNRATKYADRVLACSVVCMALWIVGKFVLWMFAQVLLEWGK